jgi:hypothetical protein
MVKDGELQPSARPKRNAALRLPIRKDIGFTRARAARYQLAARLPDDLLEEYKDKRLNKPMAF